MNTNMDPTVKRDGEPKTIVTLEMPEDAAERLLEPGKLEELNQKLTEAGLPTVESIRNGKTTDSSDRAS